MSVKWVKITTDIFDNRKIKHLRRLPEGDQAALIWIMLLTMAGRCNAGGKIFLTETIPYTTEMLADELDFEEQTVANALEVMEKLNMIVREKHCFRIAGWEEYQSEDRLAELRQKDRERKRRKRAQEKECFDQKDDGEPIPYAQKSEQEAFIERKIADEGFEGKDAEIYRNELRENLRLKYLGGTLGQNVVLMSAEQFDDLCRKLSLDEIEKYFNIVAECEKSGKSFKKKSHYRAILEMAESDRKLLDLL
jgi:predicted phage replisome organizer